MVEEMHYTFTGWVNEMLHKLWAHMFYLFIQQILSTYCMQSTSLGPRDILVNQTEKQNKIKTNKKTPCTHGAYIPIREDQWLIY